MNSITNILWTITRLLVPLLIVGGVPLWLYSRWKRTPKKTWRIIGVYYMIIVLFLYGYTSYTIYGIELLQEISPDVVFMNRLDNYLLPGWKILIEKREVNDDIYVRRERLESNDSWFRVPLRWWYELYLLGWQWNIFIPDQNGKNISEYCTWNIYSYNIYKSLPYLPLKTKKLTSFSICE